MAVSFQELNALPDILGGGRHELYFPSIAAINVKQLMLTNTQVTIPNIGVGHIKAKLLGHSLGFRGGLSFDNTLNCSFYELSDGSNVKSLFSWYKLVRNLDDGTSLLKSQYAANGRFKYINTLGEPAIEADLYNMFPVVITLPEASSENSNAVEFQVTFNVDKVDIDGTSASIEDLYEAMRGAG